MNCPCCGRRVDSTGGCLTCNPRTFCACGAQVSCGCGRTAANHLCSALIIYPNTVFIPNAVSWFPKLYI